jgi:hypothetical protein
MLVRQQGVAAAGHHQTVITRMIRGRRFNSCSRAWGLQVLQDRQGFSSLKEETSAMTTPMVALSRAAGAQGMIDLLVQHQLQHQLQPSFHHMALGRQRNWS